MKFETLFVFFFFLHWYVKGSLSKRTALKMDVAGPENILFAGASVHQPGNFTGWGSEGVKSDKYTHTLTRSPTSFLLRGNSVTYLSVGNGGFCCCCLFSPLPNETWIFVPHVVCLCIMRPFVACLCIICPFVACLCIICPFVACLRIICPLVACLCIICPFVACLCIICPFVA